MPAGTGGSAGLAKVAAFLIVLAATRTLRLTWYMGFIDSVITGLLQSQNENNGISTRHTNFLGLFMFCQV